ncbi:two-component sensor histidine kinase [Pseudorhizobium tarimense]|uniref:histidine kinase n=1 Tax=Pseudorhizobium tarimense TaxID=1079109 RepID=A0ABV2HDD6_9HYPH|nr:sensor histidine kinase [Pseudorhizobium tarimense]MCJ8521564.1 sensor histidine kinase [Pseudorhizobium tarimense]
MREFFMPALVDLGASIIIQNAQREYLFVTNLPEIWAREDFQSPSDEVVFGADVAARLATLKADMTATGQKAQLEVMVGAEQFFEFRVQTVEFAQGGLHLVTTIVDRSEERHRERLLRALLREVSHRSKNLLAIIQSIALQTARYSGSLDLFLHKFRGRLYSLSQSQDLITDSSWRGAYFFELVQQQTEKYLPENGDLVKVSGDNLLLSPNASLHLGLALHELIVNAVSHGSLLRSKMPIEVSCVRKHVDGHDTVEMVWHEPLQGALKPVDDAEQLQSHFGSTVLERVVPASVNGKAQYAISRDRIAYHLAFPLDVAE